MNSLMNKAKLLLLLRQEGVTDSRILSAFESVPREIFVDELFKNHAYENVSLPIDCGQTISQPSVIAIMTKALDLGARMKALEIGTGSGYQTAILARLCRRVYTVERHRTLSIEAAKKFFDELSKEIELDDSNKTKKKMSLYEWLRLLDNTNILNSMMIKYNISDAEKQEQTGSNITTEIDNIRTISKKSSNHEKIKELLNNIPGVLND